MINKDDRIIANRDVNQSTLAKEESKNRIKAIFEKLSLSQNEETNNGNIDPRNLRNNQDLANNPEQILQPKKEQSELSENIIFREISPQEAQEVIGIIYDVKISGLRFSNKFLQEKLSKTTDPKEQKMLNEFIEKNNIAINKANADKLNQELNKQLQAIIEQSQIMNFIEQSEKYQKQRKAESNFAFQISPEKSNFAFQISPENNSQLSVILNKMGISFQTVSGEKDSSVLVIDQDVNNQMAVQNIEQKISQYQSQFQSQSQIPSQSQSQIPSQSQSQGGGWVKAVSSQSNSNQTSISTNTVTNSSRPVVGAHTAALANQGKSGMVLTATTHR